MARSDVCIAAVAVTHYTKLDNVQQTSALQKSIDDLQTYLAAGTTDTSTSSATAKAAVLTYVTTILAEQPVSAIDQIVRNVNTAAQAAA